MCIKQRENNQERDTMSRITFEEDPFSRKVMMILLMVQVAAMIIVLGLNTIDLYTLALAISFLTFIIFVAILIWLYSRYRNTPIVRKKSELERLLLKFQKSIQTEGNIIQEAARKRDDLFQAEKSEKNEALKNYAGSFSNTWQEAPFKMRRFQEWTQAEGTPGRIWHCQRRPCQQ
jgi:Ca2+/Na+ antiporter